MKNNWTCLLKSAFLSEDKFTFHLKQIDLGIIELGEGRVTLWVASKGGRDLLTNQHLESGNESSLVFFLRDIQSGSFVFFCALSNV